MARAMVGLNGIVIKSHGGTDLFGFQRAIEVAVLGGAQRRAGAHRAAVGRFAQGLKEFNVLKNRRHRQLSAGKNTHQRAISKS